MATRKPRYDWSLLDKYVLYDFFQEISPLVVGQTLSVTQFHTRISRYIKKHLPVRISKNYNPKVDRGTACIGGLYYSELDRKKQKCIEICFVYNPSDKEITYTQRRFNRMCNVLVDSILHELIHMRQYRRRNFKEIPDYESTAQRTKQRVDQSYYGCPDEIDAYAFNITCELLRHFDEDPKKVERYLSKNYPDRKIKSHCLKEYLRAFSWDNDHEIIRKVKARAIRYLPNAVVGKPYRNRDWISC